MEALIDDAAARWGVPPWVVRAECSEDDWSWFLARRIAEGVVRHQQANEAARRTKRG